ncbi:F-box/LRR-repeat protein 10 [Magnolia sinica]|uniref:F-box/LRR-repeat protein 10 n=1 Tax=Magnolia sinica TaxID=86752 RepID=UPI002657D5DE|nr:F-box/LRR-repeat protein 10 [Magnolia sinica]
MEEGDEEKRGACKEEDGGLQHLPSAVIATILTKLDIPSLCSTASSCRSFHSISSHILSFLPDFHLLDIAPTIDLLRPLLPPNPNLRSLKLDCGRLNDSSITYLVRPSLHELCLHNCENFSGMLLLEVGCKCADLRSLSVGSLGEKRGHEILVSDVEELIIGCRQLESLSLMFDVSRFSHQKFAQVWATAANLRVLEIVYIDSVMMIELLRPKVGPLQPTYHMQPSALPCLQKLRLSVDFITDSLVSAISKGLMSLTHLDLLDAPVMDPDVTNDLTNSGLQQINLHRKLKHLSLIRNQEFMFTYFRRVNDLGILLMADRCSNLESICLGGFCRVTDAGFRAILHACSNLNKLRVCHGTQLTDLVFHDISATSLSLMHVSLRWCILLTNLAIMRLACNKDLRVLDLGNCRNVGDEALRVVSSLPKLKIVKLDGSDITDLGLLHLAQSTASLISLSVRGCKRLTDQCISAIFSSSFGQTLQVLDLSNLPNLSDDGILSLAKSGVPVSELRMRECPLIGDISVMALASMQVKGGWCGSSLRLLDLYESGCISGLAFRWFKKPYFPRLRWLGVTGSVNRDLVDALVRNRPYLHMACHGEELGSGYWDDKSDGFCWSEHEEVDELEQWLLEGGDESDEIEGEMMEE